MPISRNDTIWLYASDAFFRNITSPRYRVEMARRLQAAADIDLVELARLAAAVEGKPGDTIEQLKSASALPPEFGPLPDGSHVRPRRGRRLTTAAAAGAGRSCRSSTCPSGNVTRAEVSEYKRVRRLLSRQLGAEWIRSSPRVKRTALGGQPRAGRGRRADEPLRAAALRRTEAAARSGRRSAIRPDRRRRRDAGNGDELWPAVRRVVRHGAIERRSAPRSTCAWCSACPRGFARAPAPAVADNPPAPTASPGPGVPPAPEAPLEPIPAAPFAPPAPPAGGLLSQLTGFGRLRDLLVGYIGTTGELGPLSVLNLGIPPSDAAGYAVSPLGGWRRQYDYPGEQDVPGGRFTVFSFQRDVLETVVPQLRFEKAVRPAQVRLKVGDLSQRPDRAGPQRSRLRANAGDVVGQSAAVERLGQQLHVPPAACLDTAERLLDAKIICPLGGKYVLRQSDAWAIAVDLDGAAAASALLRRTLEGPCPAGLSVAPVELVSRPRPRRHDDREDRLRPRRSHHADAGEEMKVRGTQRVPFIGGRRRSPPIALR